jgi:hypothetical protein
MKKLILYFVGILLLTTPSLRADEGMWLLPLLEKLNIGTMTEMGLKLTAEDIYSVNNSSLKDAVVIFGGGCTAEIVSDQGLLLTNHHCGYGLIQAHSTPENNYLEDGFWAGNLEEELPNPGLSVTFLVRIEDVTERVKEKMGDVSEEEATMMMRSVGQEIASEATEGTHYRGTVRPFFGGNEFYLLVYEIYQDVRFVGAPPSSIGKFGHDTDNWMWPRHTGDFSIFRVYMSPDGKPAEYSEDNVPLKPRHHFPVSVNGVEKGDFAMVLGYPGGTQRYMTSYEIDELLNITHPNRIKIRGARQEIIWADMMADEKIRIQYASKYSGSSNYWKFSIGQSKGLKGLNIKAKKQKQEEAFTKWLSENPGAKEKYGNALSNIMTAVESRADLLHSTQYMQECLLRGSEIIGAAGMVSGGGGGYYGRGGGRGESLSDALSSGDEEQIAEAIERTRERAERFYKNYNAPTDQKVVKVMLKMFMEDVKPEHQPDYLKEIKTKYKGDYDKFVDKMFAGSILASEAKFNEFLDNPSEKVIQKDPAILMAQSVSEKYRELQQQITPFAMQLGLGSMKYIAGVMEMHPDKVFYPDANFTMRLTYGTVGDYEPADAVIYKYFTTLKGVMEKEDPDNYEFIVDPFLKKLYEKKDYGRYGKDGEMVVCFTTNNDITGGNSGSPVLNGNGELIGIAFDGNWEAMSGDIVFEPELQKCINVDIRYVLFIIDKYAGAKHLVDEMTVVE